MRLLLVRLVPNAPEENPVEDIWLQGKNQVRKDINHKDFAAVQFAFERSIKNRKFSFDKIRRLDSYYK